MTLTSFLSSPRKRALAIAAALAGLVASSSYAATSVTLAWDPNPPAENVTGYVIHYGPSSRSAPGFSGYPSSVDVGNQTQRTIAGLDETKNHYFAVVAYNAQEVRSDYSVEVMLAATTPPRTFTLTASAGPGGAINPSGLITVAEGDSRTFNVVPSAGHQISDVLVDGASAGAVSSYSFPSIGASHTIHAVFAATDSDGDSLPDAWEQQYFGGLSASAGGDLDGDGIDNYTEFLQGTDPTQSNLDASLTPAVRLPVSGGTVTTRTPALSVYNPLAESGADVAYEFEVATAPSMADPAASARDVAGGVGITDWTVPTGALADDTRYFWRARVWSGSLTSPWTPVCTFYVNTQGIATGVSDAETAYVLAAESGNIDVGDAASSAYRVAVDLPAGTLPYDFVATIRTVNNAPTSSQTRLAGKVYEFGPHGVPLNRKAKIWIPYSDEVLAAAAVGQPDKLNVFTYNTASLAWESVPIWAVDYLSQRLVCEVEHFSMYAIGVRDAGSTPPPSEPPPTEGGGGGGGGGCFLQSLW